MRAAPPGQILLQPQREILYQLKKAHFYPMIATWSISLRITWDFVLLSHSSGEGAEATA